MFMPTAPMVLNAGHVFKKRKKPSREITAVPTDKGRQRSDGTSTPRKPRQDATKPTADRIQKTLLMFLNTGSLRPGSSHDRAGL